MHTQNFYAGLALLSVASASSAFNDINIRQAPNCSTGVHVIAVGGANYSDPYDLGRLTPTAQSIVARIPGSSYVSVPYDKINVRHNPKAVPRGITNLVNYVNQYHAACPKGKIALVGYSSGAVITMDGICEGYINPDLAGNTIVATIAYGDQTRVPGLPYDLGTCKSGHGKLASKRKPAGCAAFANSIQSYCDLNDPECCGGPAKDYMIHFVYPGEYDIAVAEYVASKFKQAGGSIASSSASTTASSTHSGEARVAGTAAESSTTAAPMSYTASSYAAAEMSAAATLNNATFSPMSPAASSTLTPANPNGAPAAIPATGILAAALAAVLFLTSMAK